MTLDENPFEFEQIEDKWPNGKFKIEWPEMHSQKITVKKPSHPLEIYGAGVSNVHVLYTLYEQIQKMIYSHLAYGAVNPLLYFTYQYDECKKISTNNAYSRVQAYYGLTWGQVACFVAANDHGLPFKALREVLAALPVPHTRKLTPDAELQGRAIISLLADAFTKHGILIHGNYQKYFSPLNSELAAKLASTHE